jgi:hypothetical protein
MFLFLIFSRIFSNINLDLVFYLGLISVTEYIAFSRYYSCYSPPRPDLNATNKGKSCTLNLTLILIANLIELITLLISGD